jgi:hypothetical protein
MSKRPSATSTEDLDFDALRALVSSTDDIFSDIERAPLQSPLHDGDAETALFVGDEDETALCVALRAENDKLRKTETDLLRRIAECDAELSVLRGEEEAAAGAAPARPPSLPESSSDVDMDDI